MFKKLFLGTLCLFSVIATTSCDAFEKAGDIKDYVGTYSLVNASEKTYHVYWGNKTLTKEVVLFTGVTLIIYENKTVTYINKDGIKSYGKIKCLEKYCRFYNTGLDSSYKFYKRYDNALYYSYESPHMSVEYDVTYRSIVFRKEAD